MAMMVNNARPSPMDRGSLKVRPTCISSRAESRVCVMRPRWNSCHPITNLIQLLDVGVRRIGGRHQRLILESLKLQKGLRPYHGGDMYLAGKRICSRSAIAETVGDRRRLFLHRSRFLIACVPDQRDDVLMPDKNALGSSPRRSTRAKWRSRTRIVLRFCEFRFDSRA